MTGFNEFLGKPSIVLDTRVMSMGAKLGDSAGTQANSERAAAFVGQFADLSRQEGKAADKANLASLSNRTMPTLVQQSFLLAAGTAEAAWHGASEPETVLPDTRSIANPQASGKMPDSTNFAERLVIVPGGTPAMTPNPTTAGASPGVQEDTRGESAGSRRGYMAAAGAMASVSMPVPAAMDVHDLASSIGPMPLVGESGLDGAAAQEIVKAYARHPADPNGSRDPDFAAPAPVGVLVVNQQTHFAPPNGLSPAQQMAHRLLGSAPASMAGDANGLAPSIGPVPPAGESAFDSAASNEIVKPHATVVTDQKSDHGPDFAASARRA